VTRAVLGIVSFNVCTANRHSCCGKHELIERPRLERRLAAYEEGESENTKRSQTASERQEPSCETDWARQVTTGINSKELIQCRHMSLDEASSDRPLFSDSRSWSTAPFCSGVRFAGYVGAVGGFIWSRRRCRSRSRSRSQPDCETKSFLNGVCVASPHRPLNPDLAARTRGIQPQRKFVLTSAYPHLWCNDVARWWEYEESFARNQR